MHVAKFAAKAMNLLVNSVAMEDDLTDISLNIDQETPVVTSFADAGPRRLAGNYDYNHDLSGNADFATGQSDATLFALLGSAGVATDFDPTGAAAGANNPHYTSASMLLSSCSIGGSVGDAVKISANLVGNAALVRAVA